MTVEIPAVGPDLISHYSDARNVFRFVEKNRDACRWLKEKKSFVRFRTNLGRWTEDGIYDLYIDSIVRSRYEQAAKADDNTRKALADFARKSESSHAYGAVVTCLRSLPEFSISLEDFDADPYLINTANAVIDLSGGKLEVREHDPSDLCMQQTNAAHDPTAVPVTFLETLSRCLPNEGIRRAYQILKGQSLIGRPLQHVIFELGGGANGKTTLGDAIAATMGSYAKNLDPSTIGTSWRDGAAPSPDIARIAGARLVQINDPKKNLRLDEGLIKNLSGGDRITARYSYGLPFEFTFAGTVFMRTNHLPSFDGGDFAMRRRVLVVPFDVTIPKEEQDELLPEKLRLEAAGILNWLIEGALDYIQSGLKLPEEVVKATKAYISSEDPVGRFCDDHLNFEPTAIAANDELYGAWKTFFEEEEGPLDNAPKIVPRSKRALKNELKRRYPEINITFRTSTLRGVQGVGLQTDKPKEEG